MFRISFIFILVCAACKECPECPCLPADQVGSAGVKASDTALQETDASVPASPMGPPPQEVTSYELHGRAGFERVNVFKEPDMDSPRLGYLRKGQRTMVGDPKYTSESCPGGWFKLAEGGFVCQGRGMLVGTKPRYIPRPPPPPKLDELDPYRHGFIRKDWTPVYKRIPAEEEMWTPPTREIGEAPPDGGPAPTEVLPHAGEGDEDVDGGVDYYKYTKRRFRSVRELLSRGFWVSVASRRFDENTHRYYYETVHGDFVPGDSVHLVKPATFKGYEVKGDSPLPAVIVHHKHASFFTQRNGRFRGIGPVDRLSSYRVYESVKQGATTYYRIKDDRWLKSDQVEHFALQPPPEDIADGQKWIRVNLSRQTLEAYEGAMPVYVTLVSTGLPESEETVTPKGRFYIRFKHITDNMAGTVGDDEAYSVADVPWVQYLHLNVALHGSFWHSSYGTPKSHGRINLSPADARWLFHWTDPPLPEKWHGVLTTEDNPGTLVIIEGKTPDV